MALLAEKDIDDTMAADWAAIQEKHALPEEEAPPIVEAEPVAVATEEEPAVPVAAKPRDETGKFVKPAKAPVVKDSKQPAAPKTAVVAEPETPEQPQAQTRDVNRAPSTWKPAIREEWAKLPPTVRAEIHRREADFQHGQAQLLPDARFGQQLRQVIDPYKMLIEADGGTPERAVSDLMRTAATLRIGTDQEKLNALIGIVKQYRIDLRPLLNGQPAQQPQQEFRDPRVDQLLARQQADEQQRTVAQSRDLETAVTSFLNEVDATGNPKREYLGEVMNDMTALLPQIQAANPGMTHTQALEAAYDRAIWAHPEVRTVLQTRQQTELQQQRTADNQLRVRDAKRAASVNVPRRASIPSPSAPGKLEETIRDTARELGLFT